MLNWINEKVRWKRRCAPRFAGQDRAAIRALPVLQAYQAYYKRLDKTYHVQLQLESVALKGKPIPRVAALVEAMFMAELQNLLLTAGHDLDCLELPIRLDVSLGSERFLTMGGQEQLLKPGDMMMADRAGVISSVIYGIAERTSIRSETQNVMFTVYAPAGIPAPAVAQHLREIEENVRLVAPAELLQVMG